MCAPVYREQAVALYGLVSCRLGAGAFMYDDFTLVADDTEGVITRDGMTAGRYLIIE